MSALSLTWRIATQDELERTGVIEQGTASLIDGAGALLRDGALIALFNEYGTAVWLAEGVDLDAAEGVNEHALDLIA